MRKTKMMKGLLFATALCLVGAGAATLKTHSAKAEGLDFEIAAASVRYRPDEQNGNGLKFAFVISNADYEAWLQKEGAQFGAVILPTDLLDGDLTIETEDAHVETELEWSASDLRDGYMQADVYLYGMSAEEYNRAVTVVGFASATNETTQYTLAKSTSIAEQALESLENEQDADKIAALENYLNEYTVTFVDENGDPVASTQTVTYGASWTEPTNVTAPTGKELDYWEVRNADNTYSAYDANASKKVTGNVQLRAAFKAIQRTVTFTDMEGNEEEITATYGVGLEKDPDMGYTYSYGDALVLPYVNGTKVASINAESFNAIEEDTTVAWNYAYNRHFTYDKANSKVVATETAQQNRLAHIALNKQVTSAGFIVKMTLTNTMATPCVGINLYNTDGSTVLADSAITGGGGSIQFEANYNYGYRIMPGSWNTTKTAADGSVIWLERNGLPTFTLPPFDGGDARELVFIYDGTNLQLYSNGAWAATISYDLAAKFGSSTWTVGIGAWCLEAGTMSISDISVGDLAAAQAYIEQQDALGQISKHMTGGGGIRATGPNSVRYYQTDKTTQHGPTTFEKSTSVYLSGTFKHDAAKNVEARFQGFQLNGTSQGVDDYAQVFVAHHGVGFIQATSGWDNAWAMNGDRASPYLFSHYAGQYTKNIPDNWSSTRIYEMDYVLAIENDWLYLWFDGILIIRVDLVTWGQMDEGSTYNLGFYANNNNGHTSCEWLDVQYLTGEAAQAASATLIAKAEETATYRQKYEDFSSIRPYSMLENDTIGNVSGYGSTGISQVYLKDVAAATTYTFETTLYAVNFDGFQVSGGGKTMTFVTNSTGLTGFTLSTGWQSGGLAGLAAANDTTASVSTPYGWACINTHGNVPTGSAIQWYGTSQVTGQNKHLTVVVSEGILYVLVNGEAYMKLPLSEVYAEWTATTTYRIGIGSFDIQPTGETRNNRPTWQGSTASNDAAVAAAHVAKFTA